MTSPADADRRTHLARSFGGVAEAYQRGRPGYPEAAARWLVGGPDEGEPERPLRVLELGAGTGKLTERLVALGHHVVATEPDSAMLDVLARRVRVVHLTQASAEDLPFFDERYDVVVAAQCFHWFDPATALPEIARVLRVGGVLSLAWNLRDERVPWVRRLGRVLAADAVDHRGSHSAEALDDAPWFGEVERRGFTQWQTVDRASVLDLALSRSNIATLPAEEREAKLAEVLAFYDDFGRGMDGMRVPYTTTCFRTRLVSREGLRSRTRRAPDVAEGEDGAAVEAATDDVEGSTGGDGARAGGGPAQEGEETVPVGVRAGAAAHAVDPPTDDDSGVLLIDFR